MDRLGPGLQGIASVNRFHSGLDSAFPSLPPPPTHTLGPSLLPPGLPHLWGMQVLNEKPPEGAHRPARTAEPHQRVSVTAKVEMILAAG